MAGKLLKETKDIEVKKKKRNNKINDDNIYKIDLDIEQNEQDTMLDELQVAEPIINYAEEEQEEQLEEDKKAKTRKTKTKAKNDNSIIKIEDDEEEIDEIFGNVNRWLKDAEDEVTEKRPRRRLAKIEEGIRTSKTTKEEKTTKAKKVSAATEEQTKTKTKAKSESKTATKKTAKTTTTKTKKTAKSRTNSKSLVDDIYNLDNIDNIENINATDYEEAANYQNVSDDYQENTNYEESSKTTVEKQNEIKMHAANDLTEIVLKKNRYKIELQKTEYNIYTDTNETSYIIVRDPGLRIVSGGVYILLEKQGEDYEITTNQDFKINYVIDNLERKNNIVNFKLTNLTEIEAYEDGLVFEIDEEKVIENNLEDNNTLVISEEDGKVYLPYTKEDIKNDVMQNRGTKISEVIEEKYILPLDKYKNSMRARFREGYNLMYRKEGKSKRSAIMLGIELMFETNLHPAIISACKNLEELDIYLDCLEDNELEKFSCFKIIYKSLPTLRKKAKFQEF